MVSGYQLLGPLVSSTNASIKIHHEDQNGLKSLVKDLVFDSCAVLVKTITRRFYSKSILTKMLPYFEYAFSYDASGQDHLVCAMYAGPYYIIIKWSDVPDFIKNIDSKFRRNRGFPSHSTDAEISCAV